MDEELMEKRSEVKQSSTEICCMSGVIQSVCLTGSRRRVNGFSTPELRLLSPFFRTNKFYWFVNIAIRSGRLL